MRNEYTVEQMLEFQLHDNFGNKIIHSDNKKPYYVKDLLFLNFNCNNCVYRNCKEEKLVENQTKSSNKEFKKMQGRKKKKFNDKQVEEIIQMSKNGISNRKIAKEFHCSEKTIRNYLKQNKDK